MFKARGTWAEVQLEGILDQTIPHMYEKNFATGADTGERVEVRHQNPLGDENKEITYLPIDSKFPMEDFVRLCDAADARAMPTPCSVPAKRWKRGFWRGERPITKYIRVPRTTPFAIMYPRDRGVVRGDRLVAHRSARAVAKGFKIMIAGPTTITALLKTLSMGFRAVAINDKANEVRTLLAAAKVQYDKFGDMLDKAKRKIDEGGRSLDDARDRTASFKANSKAGTASSTPPRRGFWAYRLPRKTTRCNRAITFT
jgi:DNA recombination protein RmuC